MNRQRLIRYLLIGLVLGLTAMLGLFGCNNTKSATQPPANPPASSPIAAVPTDTTVVRNANVSPVPGTAVVNLKQGIPVADLGFRPERNGFNFSNYGAQHPEGSLTIDQARQLFGDSVCTQITNNKCTPLPAALLWVQQVNDAMNGGHCEGMAVFSLALFQGSEQPATYGAAEAFLLQPSVPVLRKISQLWATQLLEPVNAASIQGSPQEILNTLIQAINSKGETYVIGIFQDGKGGHSLAPFFVEDQGSGIFWIHVYDVNFPGVDKYIEIDTSANTWKYALAAPNPSQDPSPWSGDATTRSMSLIPNSIRQSKFDCPFCAATNANNTVWIAATSGVRDGNVDLVVTNDQGQRVGTVGGKVVNEVPGANVRQPRGLLFGNQPPMIGIPAGMGYTISLSNPAGDPAPASLKVFNTRQAIAINNIKLAAGETNRMAASGDGKKFNFSSSGSEKPDILLASDGEGNDYLFDLDGMELEGEEDISLDFDPESGKLSFKTTGAEKIDLAMVKITPTGTQLFSHKDMDLGGGSTAMLDPEEWSGEGDFGIGIDENGDGQTDEELNLTDEPLADQLDSGDEDESMYDQVDDLLESVGSYADEAELEDLLKDSDLTDEEKRELISELSDEDQTELNDYDESQPDATPGVEETPAVDEATPAPEEGGEEATPAPEPAANLSQPTFGLEHILQHLVWFSQAGRVDEH